ncbi:hypothetical protein Pla110_01000 [Polystyrenella longa]|uniref:Uncharacterized protein n=1 Tax=Polystyrenella longa TaxID=2528007 RepID=A0A518CGP9_9PLAN|nr:hypothetical protein [Polystyrenella longa]QDU78399.1 hypothetical protein Pla110_01000 [Polystyrenella longa]
MKWKNQFARKVTAKKSIKSTAAGLLVLCMGILSGPAAEACWLDRLFHLSCWSPCVSGCTPTFNQCPCSPMPYVPAYSYQPMMSLPIGPSGGCGCGGSTPGIYPGHWHQSSSIFGITPTTSYPVTGSVTSYPQTQYSQTQYPQSQYSQTQYPQASSHGFSSSAPANMFMVSQQGGSDYSEWESVPTAGSRASLQGVIVEPGENTNTGYPVNPITEKQVPTPRDQSYYQPQSYETYGQASSPQNRVAKARAFRERFVSRQHSKYERASKDYRSNQTHSTSDGIQHDHRKSVKAPTAAIVWQTP